LTFLFKWRAEDNWVIQERNSKSYMYVKWRTFFNSTLSSLEF
jgi:hypothetical protein